VTILAGHVALTGLARPVEAGLLDVRPWLTQTAESSVRTLDPLIDLTFLPWPYAYLHTVERTDRFTNTSLDTTLTLTAATAMALDPEQLGIADLNAANAEAAEQAARAAHSDYSLWGSDVLPYDPAKAAWNPPGVRVVNGAGLPLQFPLTLEPQESAWLVSRAYNIGTIASMGELLIGWRFEGATSGWTPPSLGDVNADGQIDLADFGVLKANVGAENASWFQGDMDGDGKVSLSDFGLFKQSFGSAAAPEPSTLILALLGLGIAATRWRGRR
jgi:hypothetical protein